MKKLLAVILLLAIIIPNVQSQYYYIPNLTPGQNPGGINTDGEFPVGSGLPSGWSTILPGGSTSPSYSSNQSIPFSFNFNGSAETQYKVSNSGILTFDISTNTNPGTSNSSLPSAQVPDKSICIWGIGGPGTNDNIVTKTFGNSPNRQHWILFSSYDLNGNWSYWSIVLEETTDNIYIVDQRHQNPQTGVTLGIQLNSTTAFQVSGSPNISTQAGTDSGPSDNAWYEFRFGTLPDYDLAMEGLHTPEFLNLSMAPFELEGHITNMGGQTISSFDLNYRVNSGVTQTANITGVNIPLGSGYDFVYPSNWNPTTSGSYTIEVWTSNPNGNTDQYPANDSSSHDIVVSDPIPNLIDVYLTNIATYETIGSSSNAVGKPTDLGFHPDLQRYELWVLNYGTANSGGSTVTFSDAGKANQTSQWKQDGNAWHFMSLPTGIAFGENGNFATTTGIYDANQNGGAPFTGPALWSSDPNIYAQPSGGNGSHLDMLHASPNCMGVAHESGNAFWVFDGFNGDICWYDFAEDHGPGNADHADGKVYRVSDFTVSRINDQIGSHLKMDKSSGWLYIVDGGNKRILRMDANSGNTFGTPSFGPYEPLAEYYYLNNVTWEVLADTGLVEPSGIEVIDDRMIVSDHATGDIVIYDISGVGAVELGRIETGIPGIMGLEIGPEGFIWYVNNATNEVVKIGQGAVGITENQIKDDLKIFPNPAKERIFLQWDDSDIFGASINILDATGRIVKHNVIDSQFQAEINSSGLSTGTYFLEIVKEGNRIFSDRITIMD